ncbi:ATP-binding protein [Hyphomicrobium sp. CS1BSMeth3]|uniref:ATP-binding protein n=1 Tax=Hyphomicrobium sp. CS1BSMeth3 TaxID=1892844 RepID=UPI0015761DBE|nr:ATP-binding protein [Hyphomicrobium sp. CS1BSMeth3]
MGTPSRGGVIIAATLTLAAALVLGIAAMWSSRATGPIVLGFLSLLAVIGVFFLFGTAAGLIRLNVEDERADLSERATEGLDLGFLVTDAAGRTLKANRAFRRIVGEHPSGEPRAIEDAFAGEPEAGQCLFRLLRAVERGEARQEEFRIRGQDGRSRTSRWLRVTVRPIPAALGGGESQPRTLWQVADITQEHARVAETLRSFETRLAYYDGLPLGVLELAPDGRVTEINGTLAVWLGREAPADPAHDVRLDDLFAQGAEAAIRTALAVTEGQWTRVETELSRGAGVFIPVEIIAVPPANPALNAAVQILVLHRRTRASADSGPLRKNGELARFLNAAPFGMATIAGDGRVLNANATFGQLFRDRDTGSIATTADIVARIADSDARASLKRAAENVLKGRAAGEPVEVTLGAEGEFTRRLFFSPVPSGDGEAAAVIYVIDATEQKALEIKYAQSTKMEAVGKLAGGIAHDFNNVLTAIIGFSDLLLQTHRPTDAAYKDIMNIKQNANRAAGMVRQLLAFSRRQTLMPEVLELGDVISDTSTALLRKLIGETVQLETRHGRDLWLIKADRTQLDQVLLNLAVNAKDAMPNGGRLIISTRNVTEGEARNMRQQGMVPGEYVELAVTDTGHGMTPEIMAKIFEPFFSTKEVGKGTGLGLSTVYGIVKQTGGFIFPESAPGQGTTFRIYLPRYVQTAADKAAEQRPAKKEKARDLTGSGRVLLVEDEDSVRSFAIRALKRQGYDVIEATSGAEGLEKFEEVGGQIDLIVSDVVMPEMDGPTMLNELRKQRPDIKIIFMSGYPDDAFKRNLNPGESFAFLAKPFTLPQLAAKVKEELER